MPSTPIPDAKHQLRRRLVAARAQRSEADRAAAGETLAETGWDLCRSARTVAAYADIPGEPPTGSLRRVLRIGGVRVLLPLVVGSTLDWAVDDDELRPGPLGAPTPTGAPLGATALRHADIVIVPALAVDRSGHRLGRGRGFYDRALGELRDAESDTVCPRRLIVACVFPAEILDELPTEDHDVAVDAALTTTGLIHLS